MVLATNQWLTDGNDGKPVCTATAATTTTTPITDADTVPDTTTSTTTVDNREEFDNKIGTTPRSATIRTMTTTIASGVENELLATTTPTTTTTSLTSTISITGLVTTTTTTKTTTNTTDELNTTLNAELLNNTDTNVGESDGEAGGNCDSSMLLLDNDEKGVVGEIENANIPMATTTTTTAMINKIKNNYENNEQYNNLNNYNNNNNINNNNNNKHENYNNNNENREDIDEEDNNFLSESTTNTLQNSATTTIANINDENLTFSNMKLAVGCSKNWCNTENSAPTDNYFSALGLNISSMNKAIAMPVTAKNLNTTYLNDDLATETTIPTAGSPLVNTVNPSNFDVATNSIVDQNGQSRIVLMCETNSHPFQTRSILLTPNIECKVGRLIAKSKASETNAIFDCKVLSRNHAVLWYTPEDKKFWVKDTKSSNGTFINDQKLGNEAAELHFGDIVKFGVDVVENSRKEVHGCIIASVKLYLPDGREAISIESFSNGRSAYSGEKFITYDDLHRLNLYIQEVSSREKNLKSKLFNIQNMLDATRKNSGLCWQSLIAEDQLLHRIHMLEKKLQVMEKNVPESSLRNEVIKLLEDKNSYQQTAKEALNRVYQDRCEARQLLTKMEASFTQAEDECKLLREQVMKGKQCTQELTNHLKQMENEFIDYKDESQRQQQEAKEEANSRAMELMNALRDRDMECDELKRKISELLLSRANAVDNVNAREAIESIDAVFADIDPGEVDDDEIGSCGSAVYEINTGEQPKRKTSSLNVSEVINGVDVVQLNNSKNERKMAENLCSANGDKIKASPMLKWFENSDLKKEEGSLDILNAMCNDSDSSEELDSEILPPTNNKSKRLRSLYNNLRQLEMKLHNVTENDKFIEHSKPTDHNKSANKTAEALSHNNDKTKNLTLLKNSVALLREAYNEILMNQDQDQEQPEKTEDTQKKEFVQLKLEHQATLKEDDGTTDTLDSSEMDDDSSILSEPVTARFLNISTAETAINHYKEEVIELREKLQNIELESNTNIKLMHRESNEFKNKVGDLMKQIEKLSEEKENLENILAKKSATPYEQNESDDLEMEDKEERELMQIGDNDAETPTHTLTATTTTTNTPTQTPQHVGSVEYDEFTEMPMDTNALEREEELLLYKENLEQSEIINVQLRKEINVLKSKMKHDFTSNASLCATTVLLRYILPYGAAAFAIFYMLTHYFYTQ